ncbi:MAG: hypothetical protein RL748_2830 [Pseudomonadota bacterium]|jgi:hypothetical protein
MTQLWEITSGGINGFANLTSKNHEDLLGGLFNTDGKPKVWDKVPSVEPTFYKGKKPQPPMADFGWFAPGTVILNEKALAALQTFLSGFGEFLEMNCLGAPRYFYNVTNLISCINFDQSEKIEAAIIRPVFLQEAIPLKAQIFKDPLTAGGHIYATQAAREVLEAIILQYGLTGLRFHEAGK